MLENGEHSPHTFTRSPFFNLIMLIVGVCLGFVVIGPLIGFLISVPFYPGTMFEFTEAIRQPTQHPGIKIPVYILQGSATLVGLILTPVLLLRIFRLPVNPLSDLRSLHITPLILIPLIVISFMGLNSWFVEWNAGLHFPDALQGFERWAREKENYAAELTTFMTEFASVGELIVALVIIAIIPAIGEELVFRGLIQNELHRLTKNIHVSIWLAAVVFSAFHLQFFGFIPRVLLGALFGYLYYWSGSLTAAMLAHFINNSVALLSLYFYQTGGVGFTLEGTESLPWSAVLLSALLTFFLLFRFRQYFSGRNSRGAVGG